ncbi:uncharacterized protein LOC125248129 [Megalobrama amblycephala]|uniref:uncharacterized protein LOC125248129 n=1 Tax=Megalobrama amblycephala TaxID=75352 RepID=UPI0020147BE1|nr:uncharacterized protein LOC125248129 [Megalobrama amblycephala]
MKMTLWTSVLSPVLLTSSSRTTRESTGYMNVSTLQPSMCQRISVNRTSIRKMTQENAVTVRNAINDDSNALYQGSELIAAGTRKVVYKQKQYNRHSEYLLLNPANNSPMTRLLNRRNHGCSVFYTFNLDATGRHSIIQALKNWKRHGGIKAFVFKQFWKYDETNTEKDLQAEFKQIVAHVPLFRCVSENQCYACKGEGNTPIDAHCLPPKEISSEL